MSSPSDVQECLKFLTKVGSLDQINGVPNVLNDFFICSNLQ